MYHNWLTIITGSVGVFTAFVFVILILAIPNGK